MSAPAAATPASLGGANELPAHLRHPASAVAKWACVAFTVLFLTAMIVIPAANIFRQAFANGIEGYVRTFYVAEQDTKGMDRKERRAYNIGVAQAQKTRDAIALTVYVAAIVVPLNVSFGLAAAWAISKFRFRGRTLFVSLIDLPFAVSPVVAGLIFVLILGRVGFFGEWASYFDWPAPTSIQWQGFSESWFPFKFGTWYQGVLFTPMAIVLASAFVTFPFVARALIPLMETQGSDQEQASLTLGASGLRTFIKVTLPQIKWALLYGTILTLARCFGEFGAVSVVSGNTDPNDTMPLRIEKLWQEYNTQAAFSVASLLAVVSVLTLLMKIIIEKRTAAQLSEKKAKEGTES